MRQGMVLNHGDLRSFRPTPQPRQLWMYYKRKRKKTRNYTSFKYRKRKGVRYKSCKMVFTSAYNVDEKVNQDTMHGVFDTDASFVVCDNSASTHIYNNVSMFK